MSNLFSVRSITKGNLTKTHPKANFIAFEEAIQLLTQDGPDALAEAFRILLNHAIRPPTLITAARAGFVINAVYVNFYSRFRHNPPPDLKCAAWN